MSRAASPEHKPSSKPAQVLKDSDFDWQDPLDLEGELTEDERMVRDTARGYAQDKLMPRVLSAYREERFDREIAARDGRARAARPDHPGGIRRRRPRLRRLWADRARDRARRFRLSLAMSVQSSLVMYPIYRLRHARRSAANICRKLAKGEMVGCFGLTEPDSRLRSRLDGDARREGAGRLSSSTAPRCGSPTRRSPTSAVVWAKLDGEIRGFIVERGTKGFSTPKIEGKLSLRASVTGEIVLDDAVVPEENMLPNVKGLAGPFGCLNNGALRHRLGRDGRGRILLAPARANTCSTASSSAGRSPPISWCRRSSPTCRPRSRSGLPARCALGRLMEAGKAAPPAISLMKRNNCGKALDIARLARDMHGGNGISDEFHVMRVLSTSKPSTPTRARTTSTR